MADKPRAERAVRSRSEPCLPRGHFNEEGMSQGKEKGPVRPTSDAHAEKSSQKERK